MASTEERAVYRLVVCGDVKDSGRLNLGAKLRMRESLYQVFQDALDAVDVGPEQVDVIDRGDGLLLSFEPGVPPALIAGVWLEEVRQGLIERRPVLHDRLRMRLAMHQGPVSHDGRGPVGRAVDLACRLCDCDPARRVLDASDSDLVLVVSDPFHGAVIADSVGERFVEPEAYRPFRVSVKETDEIAWFRVPGLPVPPDLTGGGGTGTAPGGAPPAPEGREPGAAGGDTERDLSRYRIDVHDGDSTVVSARTIEGGLTIKHGNRSRRDGQQQ
ncbi:hypothetical protein [Streptomyces sp. MP131-18]|uniref:hypothetical protein n=1 Tax=Streptomyces sp. MP131-18 TaxID=1857892 RepID=UPI00097C4ADE|nr:hypothetical protein [Streptomyces sp. MP131-18]ONK10692.1 hypothetical protein STBA_14150 [Streptomyces sp. MP131-18]